MGEAFFLSSIESPADYESGCCVITNVTGTRNQGSMREPQGTSFIVTEDIMTFPWISMSSKISVSPLLKRRDRSAENSSIY